MAKAILDGPRLEPGRRATGETVTATVVGVAPADAPTSAPFIGQLRRRPASETAPRTGRAVVDAATPPVLKGIQPLGQVMGAAEATPARRPRRLLEPSVAPPVGRRSAGVRGLGPQIGRPMEVIEQVTPAA